MAEREYRDKDIYKGAGNAFCGVAPLKTEYLDKVAEMDDEKLFSETKDKIWASAYANNNPISDYHWQADACYDEWLHRKNGSRYQKAWEETRNEATNIQDAIDKRGLR